MSVLFVAYLADYLPIFLDVLQVFGLGVGVIKQDMPIQVINGSVCFVTKFTLLPGFDQGILAGLEGNVFLNDLEPLHRD